MEGCLHSGAIESLLDVGVGADRNTNIFFKISEEYTGMAVQICSRYAHPKVLYFSKKMESINCRALLEAISCRE